MDATYYTGQLTLSTTADAVSKLKEDLDMFWVLVAAIIVFFMQAGFTMLEAGTVAKYLLQTHPLQSTVEKTSLPYELA